MKTPDIAAERPHLNYVQFERVKVSNERTDYINYPCGCSRGFFHSGSLTLTQSLNKRRIYHLHLAAKVRTM